jgi:hypothetical protein
MPIEITGDSLTMAQEMTQVERDALLIEIYRELTAQAPKLTAVKGVTDKVGEFLAGILSNPPGGLLGKMMPDMSAMSGLVLPPPPNGKRR